MKIAIRLLVDGPVYKENLYMDIETLSDIATEESYKSFLTKEVDMEHKNGYFKQFYKLSERITEIVKELSPNYQYPKTLVSILMESTLLHTFFMKHMPLMTESCHTGSEKMNFYYDLVFKTIKDEN
jgi:hypothetical protein